MKNCIEEQTNTSSGTGDYSKPIVLQRKRKLTFCRQCGSITIDKCKQCGKNKEGENG